MMFFLGVLPTWEEIANVFVGMIKGLFLNLCLGIFSLVGFLFDILVKITEVDLMDVSDIYQRAIMIFTIVITFYITFEFVKYTVSPDNISDKEKGAMPLFARIIIAILLLAFTPRIFTIAMDLQNRVINTQVLPKVILGTSGQDLSATGRDFSADLFSVFYRFDRGACLDEYNNRKCNDIEDDVDNVIKKLRRKTGIEKMLFGGSLFSSEFWTQMKVGVEFNPLFAIVFGGFMLYVLFMYCKDVALRYVQLLFLQIISPIAIISYIAPKKDGIFQKWLKQCTTTYLDIFIRLALLYFLMLVMKQFLGHNFTSGGMNANLFAKLFIIFALLRFLLKAPKLLEELFPKSGAASIGYGFSAKDRKGILGQAWTAGKQVAAKSAGAIAGVNRAKKGIKSGSLFNAAKDKSKFRRFVTGVNAMARSGYAGYKAGKDGDIGNAIRAGQEKVQSYESIVAGQGTILDHDYRPGYYQNEQARFQVQVDLLKQMEDAKGSVNGAIGEIKFRKQMDDVAASLQANGTAEAKMAWSGNIKKFEKLARNYADRSISAAEYETAVQTMITKFNTEHGVATGIPGAKDIKMDYSNLEIDNSAKYERITTEMNSARKVASTIISSGIEASLDADGSIIKGQGIVMKYNEPTGTIDSTTGKEITVPKFVKLASDGKTFIEVDATGNVKHDTSGNEIPIMASQDPTDPSKNVKLTFADFIGDIADQVGTAATNIKASNDFKAAAKNSEGKK